jgi:hypothetical protein
MLHELLRKWMPRSRRPQPVRRPSGPWKLLRLEDRTVPAQIGYAIGSNGSAPNQVAVYDTTGALLFPAFDAFPGFNVPVHTALGDVNGDGFTDLIVSVAGHGGPEVKVYDGQALVSGVASTIQLAIDTPLKDFYAFAPTFTGGVSVAVGNIPGFSIDPTAAAGSANATTPAEDIICGAGPGGGPQVKVFNMDGLKDAQGNALSSLQVLYSYYAYAATFTGGVNVAAGNVGGDAGNAPIHNLASDEVVTGAGIGGRSHVEIWSVTATQGLSALTPLDRIGQFYAYSTDFFGGVDVAVGTYTNNRDATTQAGLPTSALFADIVTTPGAGGMPIVRVWRLDDGDVEASNPSTDTDFAFVTAANFLAYKSTFTGGVSVGTTPNITVPSATGNPLPDFITGPGPGGGPDVKVWSANDFPTNFGTAANPNGDLASYTPTVVDERYAFDDGKYTNGIFVSE